MTNIELCQRARRECGIASTVLATPSTIVGQTGKIAYVIECVREGWIGIQSLHNDWKFLRKTKVFALTINVRTYGLITDMNLEFMRDFDKNGLFIEETSADKKPLVYEEWESFRARVISSTPARPTLCSVNDEGELEFNCIPDKAYVVRLSHWLTAETLDDDSDVPSIADDLHEILVWEACIRYAGNDTAGELYQHATKMKNQFLHRLEVRYLALPTRIDPQPGPGMRGT